MLQAPAYTDNLWELVAVVKGLDDSLLSPSYSKGIMHVKHLVKFLSVSQTLCNFVFAIFIVLQNSDICLHAMRNT